MRRFGCEYTAKLLYNLIRFTSICRLLVAMCFAGGLLHEKSQASEMINLPSKVVATVIKNDDCGKDKSKMFLCPPGDMMKLYFTINYINNWASMCIENEISAEHDGDVFLYGQGLGNIKLDSILKIKRLKNRATVIAKISYTENEVIGKPLQFEKVIFWLKVEKSSWKIEDHKIYMNPSQARFSIFP